MLVISIDKVINFRYAHYKDFINNLFLFLWQFINVFCCFARKLTKNILQYLHSHNNVNARRTITIDNEIYERLKKRGFFGETYGDVLCRLLDYTEECELKEDKKKWFQLQILSVGNAKKEYIYVVMVAGRACKST